jgi:hypothetical protein
VFKFEDKSCAVSPFRPEANKGPVNDKQDHVVLVAVIVPGIVAVVRKKDSVTKQQTSLLERYFEGNVNTNVLGHLERHPIQTV